MEGGYIAKPEGQIDVSPGTNGDKALQRSIMQYLAVFLPIALTLSFILLFLPEDQAGPYSDWGQSILNLVSFSIGLYTVKLFYKTEYRNVGICVSLYVLLYAIAGLVWNYYVEVLDVEAFPSLADIPWVAGYIPLIYISIATLITYHEYAKPSTTMVIYLVMFFAAILIFLPLATAIINTDSTMIEKALSLTYPVLDLFLLILVAQLVSIYRAGKLAVYWTFIMAGIVFELTADILFTYSENFDVYYPGSLADVFFYLAAFAMMFSFITVLLTHRYSSSFGVEPEGKYEIKHVFLVYPNGLLIAHLTTPGTSIVDVEIFTGMLTAVQSFIKESFHMGDPSAGLDRLRYRSLEIAIERGQNVFLAVVVDGRVTDQLHHKMHVVLDAVQTKYGLKLKDWDGDVAHMTGVKDVVGQIFEH